MNFAVIGEYYLESKDDDTSPLVFQIRENRYYLAREDFWKVESKIQRKLVDDQGKDAGYIVYGDGYQRYIVKLPSILAKIRAEDLIDVLRTRQNKGHIWLEQVTLAAGQKTFAGVFS